MPRTTLPNGSGARGATPVLSAHSVVKQFGSTRALDGVDFSLQPGEIVGLVGANGAGKSTLIGILSGSIRPTDGRLEIEGAVVDFADPDEAARAGIATVHQDVDQALVLDLTVAENLVLDAVAAGELGPWVSPRSVRRRAEEVLPGAADLDVPVRSLGTSRKQQLLIARALHRGARVLILDEPTAALSVTEQRELHDRLRSLAAEGTAIIYITHHLAEIAAICDRVVALREGSVAGEFAAPVDPSAVVTAMLGGLATQRPSDSRATTDRVVLALEGVRTAPDAAPFDLAVREGEVLGITGLLGAGKTELLLQVVGAARLQSGRMTLLGHEHAPRHPADAVAAGIGFVPEDRRASAEIGDWDIADTITLPDLRRYRRAGLLSRARETQAARLVIETLRVVASGPRAALRSLSGGNRQKVIVGRWIAAGSRVLVLDEPFRGVDLGARADLAALLRSGVGLASVVASSDPEEILEVADRILVFGNGELVAEIDPRGTDVEGLAQLMIAAASHPHQRTVS